MTTGQVVLAGEVKTKTYLDVQQIARDVIKRIGYAHVSSAVTAVDLKGRTGEVIIPFDGTDQGKITLISKGQRLQLVARAFEEAEETFEPGDEVVVVRVDGRVAEVVKPS